MSYSMACTNEKLSRTGSFQFLHPVPPIKGFFFFIEGSLSKFKIFISFYTWKLYFTIYHLLESLSIVGLASLQPFFVWGSRMTDTENGCKEAIVGLEFLGNYTPIFQGKISFQRLCLFVCLFVFYLILSSLFNDALNFFFTVISQEQLYFSWS